MTMKTVSGIATFVFYIPSPKAWVSSNGRVVKLLLSEQGVRGLILGIAT